MSTINKRFNDLEQQVQEYCSINGIVTSWILITEMKNADDTWGINVIHDHENPSWRHEALLGVAHELIDGGFMSTDDTILEDEEGE